MSVYEAITLMIMCSTFIIVLIDFLDRRNDRPNS